MRQIKFKGLINLGGQYMIVPDVAVYAGGNMGCTEEQFVQALPEGYRFDGEDVHHKGDVKVYSIISRGANGWIWFEGTPLQFIDRLDCEGDEVYEGDILEYFGDHHEHFKAEVKWWRSTQYKAFLNDGEMKEDILSFKSEVFVIKGNVYQHPEILETQPYGTVSKE